MTLLSLIFHRIAFLRVVYAPDGAYESSVYLHTRRQLTPTDEGVVKNNLVVLIVCGHGVISKPDASEVVSHVKNEDQTFCCTSRCGVTSFVRRQQLEGLYKALSERQIYPLRTLCDDSNADFEAVADACAGEVHQSLRWRELVRFTASSSAAAQVVVRRCAPLILGLFLLLLVGNTLWASSLVAQRQAMQRELAACEKRTSDSSSAEAEQQELLRAFHTRTATSYAVMCDRIAATVPAEVTLASLGVEAPVKRFEAGKPLQRQQKRIVVTGSASNAAAISRFTGGLSQLSFCRMVHLASVERSRDDRDLHFNIEIEL